MNKISTTDRYNEVMSEMQLCQRAAPMLNNEQKKLKEKKVSFCEEALVKLYELSLEEQDLKKFSENTKQFPRNMKKKKNRNKKNKNYKNSKTISFKGHSYEGIGVTPTVTPFNIFRSLFYLAFGPIIVYFTAFNPIVAIMTFLSSSWFFLRCGFSPMIQYFSFYKLIRTFKNNTVFGDPEKSRHAIELIIKILVATDWQKPVKATSSILAVAQVFNPSISVVSQVTNIMDRITSSQNYKKDASNFQQMLEFASRFVGQSDEPDKVDGDAMSKWWDKVSTSDLGLGMMQILCLLVTAGIVPEIDFSYSGIEFFSIKAAKESVKAKDFWRACENVIKSCVEGIAQYHSAGSFEGFFGSKSLESEVSYALALYQQVLIGNLASYADLTNEAYIGMLEKLKTKVMKRMRNPRSNDKFFYKTYLDRLNDTLSAMAAIELEQQTQETAFGVLFHGNSSVGKSWFAIPMIKWLLKINDYEHEDANIITYNTNSKYDDQVRNNTFGILLDDLANGKVGKGGGDQRRTSDIVIALINNVAQAAIKADLQEKGKVLMKPKVVIATTNNPELNASQESHNEASVHRRFKYEVEFIVRKGYTMEGSSEIDGEKVASEFPGQQFPDVWDFVVRRCIILDSKAQGSGKGYEMRIVESPSGNEFFNMLEFMTFLRDESRRHFQKEKNSLFLRKSNKALELDETGLPTELFGTDSVDRDIQESFKAHSFFGTMFNEPQFFDAQPDDESIERLLIEHPEIEDIVTVNNTWRHMMLFSVLPTWILRIWIWTGFNIKKFLIILFLLSAIIPYMFALLPGITSSFFSVVILIVELWFIKDVTAMSIAHTIAVTSIDLAHRNMWNYVNRTVINRNFLNKVLSISAGFTAGLILFRLCRFAYLGHSIEATTVEEAEEKISERSSWSIFRGITGNLSQGRGSTMTTEQLKNRITKSVVYVQHHVDGVKYRGTNGLFVAKGYLLLPKHFVKRCPKEVVLHIHRGNGRVEMPKVDFGQYKERKQWVEVGTDLVLIRLTGVNYSRDIRDLFGSSQGSQSFSRAIEIYNRDAILMENVLTGLRPAAVSYDCDGVIYRGKGYVASSECKPREGMCMAPIIADIRQPVIIGVHIAGTEMSKNTFVLAVTKAEIDEAVKQLDECCTFQSINQDDAYQAHSEKCTDNEVHSFCATRYADSTVPLDVIGTVPGSGPRFMQTKKTPYHEQVKSFLRIGDDYGIPKSSAKIVDGELKSPWRNCIEELNQAKNLIPYTALERAREEIVEEFTRPLEQFLKAGGIGRPLTVDEAINGVPGIRGIDGQKMSTSAGLKYGGTKKKHLENDEHPYVYKQEVYDDVADLRKKLASRTRGVNSLNSNLKDEPLKKKKVDEYRTRVFFSDELDSLIVCGQEFSPILAYLMNHPQSSHCAVGLNAQSFDWECVAKYLTRDGTVDPEDGICLDFKAFDKTLPENLMKMAWQVFIDIAKRMPGYTQEDIDIMTTMIDEKTTPYIHFNGTLVQLNFDHTSGNLCTAAVGSIAGLMLLLIAFYAIEDPNGEKEMKGLDYIRSIHLGDDLASTLKNKEELNYNFLTVQAVLKDYGITITMPDKEAEPTPFQNVFKEDFLKRIFVHCPLRNAIVGQLDRKSLYKSLLYYLPSKVETKENQLGQSLSAVLGELSLYDRNEFNDFKTFVVDLAYHYQLNVPNLWMEYDDYVIRWAVDSGKRHKEYQEREKPYLNGLIPKMSNSQQKAIYGKVIESHLEVIPENETFVAHAGDLEITPTVHDIVVEVECCRASQCCPWLRKKPFVAARFKLQHSSSGSGDYGKANISASVENNGSSERPTDQGETPSEVSDVATASRT